MHTLFKAVVVALLSAALVPARQAASRTVEPVTCESGGDVIAGDRHLPRAINRKSSDQAGVVTAAWTASSVTSRERPLWPDDVMPFDSAAGAPAGKGNADAVAALTAPGGCPNVGSAAVRELSPEGSPEVARVIAVVTSIPLAVDLARYDLAESAFAPRIVVDYTSLWGGQPSTMTPEELMTAWRSIVPGFSATRHELREVEATVQGDKAAATAFVDGRHWIDGQLWRPVGHYHWNLEKQRGQWKVTRMVFAMTREIGDRKLAALAMERVKNMRPETKGR